MRSLVSLAHSGQRAAEARTRLFSPEFLVRNRLHLHLSYGSEACAHKAPSKMAATGRVQRHCLALRSRPTSREPSRLSQPKGRKSLVENRLRRVSNKMLTPSMGQAGLIHLLSSLGSRPTLTPAGKIAEASGASSNLRGHCDSMECGCLGPNPEQLCPGT